MSSRRATASIDRLVKDRVIAPASRDWLIAAVDPFHDQDLTVRGYPDTTLAPSVVQCVKQSFNLSSPDATPTANWNANIFTTPIMIQTKISQVTLNEVGGVPTNLLTAQNVAGGGSNTLGIVNVASSSSASQLGFANSNAYLNLSQYAGDNVRIIAAGLEIVNNTAEIYKQGQITAYRVPNAQIETSQLIQTNLPGGTGAITGSGQFRCISCPPTNIATAMLLSGSRQWAAKEGYYGVIPFSSPNLPSTGLSVGGIITTPENGTGDIYATNFVALSGADTAYYPASAGPAQNQHSIGCFLTGLSPQTTLTVTLNVWLEVFPSPSDTALVVLATPSPRYDLVAMEIYSECLADMPVAVMVKENGLGDWFKSAVSKVSSWAQPVLSAIPHPIAQGSAMALGGLNAVMNVPREQSYAGLMAPPNAKVERMQMDELEDRLLQRELATLTRKKPKSKKKKVSTSQSLLSRRRG